MDSKEQMIEVIQASIEGKDIEFRCKGYLDWENVSEPAFNFDECEYRVKPSPLENWEELGEISGWYISGGSEIVRVEGCGTAVCGHRNLFTTKEQAEASLAMAQISQLIKQINGGWRPDWMEYTEKYCIYAESSDLIVKVAFRIRIPIAFRTVEQAELFLQNHRDLLEKALLI